MAIKNDLPDIFVKEEKVKKKGKKAGHSTGYYVHVETTNHSFLKLSKLLRTKLGIKNNKFFLALYDTNLIGVDPYDPSLPLAIKMRVIKECMRNFWYFAREVARIPVAGAGIGEGKRFELHRGNLAMLYLTYCNINSYTELPRQTGKTIGTAVYFVWLFNFGTTNSTMMLVNKEHKDAKDNLTRIKNIRDVLPEYLQFKFKFNEDGKRLKAEENVETAYNDKTRNRLETKPAAMSEEKADKLGRGCTQPVQWFDEYAFLGYNDIIFKSASPAASQASREAEANGKPHAQIFTSTPGDMKTRHGQDAFAFIKMSAVFTDDFYDWSIPELKEYVDNNSDNGFFYVKYSYKQLGRSQAYFKEQVRSLAKDWDKIKREVLLEWNNKAVNSPYDPDDLNELDDIKRYPISKPIMINKYFKLEIYEQADYEYPFIISVDVAAGMSKDSSAITVISTKTKRPVAALKNNTIDIPTLSNVVYAIANDHGPFPNSLIVVERNGQGEGVVGNLVHTDIKHKLFYEISGDDTKEKMKRGVMANDFGTESRVYGLWNSANVRERMHDILGNFVRKYKNRINIDLLVEEIKGLQYTKTGRIDHAPGQHDDVVMAYLLGMYVYYEHDLSRFGIIRFPDFENDDEIDEAMLEQIKESEVNKNGVDADLYRTLIADLDTIDDPRSARMAEAQEFRTLKDYYDDIDKERESHLIGNGNNLQQFDVFKQPGYNSNGAAYIPNMYAQPSYGQQSSNNDDYEDFVRDSLVDY